ncbi:MAG TPA: hypothetical protein VFV31_07995 [Chitinophagaceae bacterium]|nr:hypothetical protein [Chitinophagaceae bacterium]
MKKLIPLLLIVALVSCAKKEWSKGYLVNKCNKEMEKETELQKLLNKDQVSKICDCAADKMLAKYKSEAEADKDKAGAEEIGRTCAMEAMQTK